MSLLWVDKHRPTDFDGLELHPKVTVTLRQMAQRQNFPHLLFYGPRGAGKKTRIWSFLKSLYGSDVTSVTSHTQEIKAGASKISVMMLSSPHHVELNPSDAGSRDSHVVQHIVKELASRTMITSSPFIMSEDTPLSIEEEEEEFASTSSPGSKSQKSQHKHKPPPFRVLVLHQVDKMSDGAQHALRRTMEKHVKNCRIILCCNSICNILPPLQSRCLAIRIPAPSHLQICSILEKMAARYNFSLPNEVANKISILSRRDLRLALLILQRAKTSSTQLSSSVKLPEPDWILVVKNIVKTLIENQSQAALLEVRSHFYKLLAQCIEPMTLFEELLRHLISQVDPVIAPKIVEAASTYQTRLVLGTRPIYHLEALCAKVMLLIATSDVEQFGGFL